MQAQIHAPRTGYAYNLLDNSDFRNPVNQRGATTVSSGEYFIDRWAVRQSGMTASLGPSGMTISNSRSDNTAGYIEQVLPDNVVNSTTHAGKTYTIAAKANGDIVCATATIPNYATINVDSANQIMLIYSQSAAKWVARCIVNQTGHQMTIEWMALYEGSYTADTLPPYQPKGYAVELAECQRYFESVNSFYFNAQTNSNFNVFIPYKANKRISDPIATVYDQQGNTGKVSEYEDGAWKPVNVTVYSYVNGFRVSGTASTGYATISLKAASSADL